MELLSIRPMIAVKEVEKTLLYYKETFAFNMHYVKEYNWGYVVKDAVEIMFCSSNALEPFDSTTFTGSLYINTNDVDAWWEKLKDICPVVYPIENFSYNMREFAVKDINGIILQFGQDIS